jgi:hypothetical protein
MDCTVERKNIVLNLWRRVLSCINRDKKTAFHNVKIWKYCYGSFIEHVPPHVLRHMLKETVS